MPSTRTGSSTARRVAATASTWSRQSSAQRVGLRRRRLDAPRAPRARGRRPVRLADSLFLGPIVVGWLDRRVRARRRRAIAGLTRTRPRRQAQAQAAAPARRPRIADPGRRQADRSPNACRCRALDGPRDGPRRRRRHRRRADRARDGGRERPPPAVHRAPARVGAGAVRGIAPRPSAARAWRDDPGRLRHVLRAGRSVWPSWSCRPRSARGRTSWRACPPSSITSADWASTLRPAALSRSITELVDSVASTTTAKPPDPNQVVQVGSAAANVAVSVATLLTLVFFWLIEHARLQRYLLAYLPLDLERAPARHGTRSRPGSGCGSAAS